MLKASGMYEKKVLTYRKGHDIVWPITQANQAKVAQSVEHSTENAGVAGSIPALGTFSLHKKV